MKLNTLNVQNVGTNGRNEYLNILDEAWQQHLAPREPDGLTIISTFAGCGGSSLGYSMAGYKELLAIEWNDNAVATFKLNFPDVPIYHGDIRKLSVEQYLELAGLRPGELDLLDGSPPCQGFSTAGKRQMGDVRNQLSFEFVRLLRGLQPKVFVMENVSGLVKGKMKLIFAEIMKALKASGYQVKYQLLNAMYFHVPQSRQRLIWIGVRDDLEVEVSYPKGRKGPITVEEAIGTVCDKGRFLTPEASKYWSRLRLGESASKYHPEGHLFGLIKLHPGKVCPTLTRSAGASKHCHWKEKRFIGIQERSILNSFPVQMRWPSSWIETYNQIGNSVPPLFMRAIASHIRQEILSKASGEPRLLA